MPRTPAKLRWSALALCLVAGASDAGAEVDMMGTTIELDTYLVDEEGEPHPPTTDVDLIETMNRASCLCPEESFAIRFTLGGMSTGELPDDPVEVWVGSNCAPTDSGTDTIDDRCTKLEEAGIGNVRDLQSPVFREISIRQLIDSKQTDASMCAEIDTERQVFAIIDDGSDGFGAGDYANFESIKVDTIPPPEPREIKTTGGEDAIQVSWKLPSTTTDLAWFQVLCQESGVPSAPVDDREVGARYRTAKSVCGGDDGSAAVAASADLPPAPDLLALDPRYVCGEAPGTSTSIRVTGLKNGVTYRLVLVAADLAGNPLAFDLGEASPKPVRDFWEDYKDRGGTAEPGCQSGGGAGPLGLVLVGGALALASRRRRRGRGGPAAVGPAAALAALALIGGPRPAAAQPYLDSSSDEALDPFGPGAVSWNVDLKIGPYLPAIDSRYTPPPGAMNTFEKQGPFRAMFGDGPFILTQLTVDRFFLRSFGLLGLTASAGYLATAANAFEVDDAGKIVPTSTGKPSRSTSDRTGFRMLPTSIGAVYRFSVLDDYYGIPLVPYGRIGLSYAMWWVTQPSGALARSPTAACPMPGAEGSTCKGEKARGGSLGWQWTVGLSFRAERLDTDAASSLHNELGIAHAGFFAELTRADIDGFGDEKKLPLGDLSWAAGMNFEF
jgi:hypothetical protein